MRFGLLGTGYWATQTQAAALAGHPDVDFVAVWGRDPAKARALAGRYQVRAEPDLDALLDAVEAVAIAVPPDVQADLAVRAAGRGCHLLLDKPVALSVTGADRVVRAVEDARVSSVVFFTNRFVPLVRDFLAAAAGGAGRWSGARTTMFASIFGSDSPYAASAWRRRWGGLWDVGPHALSLILPVLGPVSRVAAMNGPYDSTHVLLRHDGGAVSTMALALNAPAAATAQEFVFHSPDGFVEVPRLTVDPVTAARTAITELVGAARAGRTDHPCDVRFGRDVVAILHAAETARRQDVVVRLDEPSGAGWRDQSGS